jgi:hypothetical protein
MDERPRPFTDLAHDPAIQTLLAEELADDLVCG